MKQILLLQNYTKTLLVKTHNLCDFIKLLTKGDEDMAVIYANLIIEGYRTFASVPKVLKAKVKAVLEQLGLSELATEE